MAPARRPWRFTASVVVLYLCLGLIAFGPSLLRLRNSTYSRLGDYDLFVWFLGWAPHAVAHGLNPFFTQAMLAPNGFNLAQNTEGPLLGWVLAPITMTLGPIAAANLLMVLAMPLSATAAFVVLMKWKTWPPAAAVGGLIYGFSAYMIGEALGHPVLLFVPLPPIILAALVSIFRGQRQPWRRGLQLGFLLTAQFLISPEIFTSLCVVTAIGLVLVALRFPQRALDAARNSLLPLAVALGICVIFLSYPVWMLLAGPQHVAGATYSLNNPYHTDLLSFVTPGAMQRVTLGVSPVAAGFLASGVPVEAGGYVGIPLLIIGAILGWRSRASGRMQLLLALFAVCAILSLGPILFIHGHSTHIPLPFWVFGHLPLVGNLLPVRFSFEMAACLAGIVAFGLHDLYQSSASLRLPGSESKRSAAVLATVVVVIAIVVTQLPRWPYHTTSVSLLPATMTRSLPAGDPVAITYPHAYGSQLTLPMLWQADSDYSFRILGGYAFHRDEHGKGSDIPDPESPNDLQNFLVLSEFWNTSVERYLFGSGVALPPPPVTPGLVAATKAVLSRYDVRTVIIDRRFQRSDNVVRLFTMALGAPTYSTTDYDMWKVG